MVNHASARTGLPVPARVPVSIPRGRQSDVVRPTVVKRFVAVLALAGVTGATALAEISSMTGPHSADAPQEQLRSLAPVPLPHARPKMPRPSAAPSDSAAAVPPIIAPP